MNNAQFKLECFKNGLYSPEQVIGFYNTLYKENTKFNKRDAQLWMNGKSWGIYVIDQTAIEMINMLNKIRAEIIADEKERIEKYNPRYTEMFKTEADLWEVHKELIDLPLNFYNSILIEMKVTEIDYYGNLSILEDNNNEH
ncbi:hypothetical protein [Acinetobacter baumannii]|uniref:hypothetical protein n=1 Tax=Acinetobacter baumannii TaxID=470 RepID=UPI002AB5D704|nr:hypothetical protein [Acinetobacter baumannii]MDY7730045.1 hypothetical protein [Acinetobacter baumannii]